MRDPKRYENLERMVFDGVGEYGIPTLKPVDFDGDTEFIPFNFAATSKDREKKSIHFFIDDYQFIRLWNDPDRYIPMLQQFQYVFTPDFSLYTDFPKAVQIFNHYRKHWIGAYMQMYGVKVIPTIAWSTEDSYSWCFDGEPTGGTVAVSSVGCMQNKKSRELDFVIDRNSVPGSFFAGDLHLYCLFANSGKIGIKNARDCQIMLCGMSGRIP